jgi:hypothetical protein
MLSCAVIQADFRVRALTLLRRQTQPLPEPQTTLPVYPNKIPFSYPWYHTKRRVVEVLRTRDIRKVSPASWW